MDRSGYYRREWLDPPEEMESDGEELDPDEDLVDSDEDDDEEDEEQEEDEDEDEEDDGENETSDPPYGQAIPNVPEATVKTLLVNALGQIQSFGTFASFGHLPGYTDPQITLRPDEPPIQLPLQEADAQRIIAASHEAPFGRGAETIVDRSVRRTWELDPHHFNISDSFRSTESRAVKEAVTALGVQTTAVSFRRYKLLLYEPGALFRPHTDTEKEPGMFATLVICLPSAHEGGELGLTHQGSTKRFSTAEMQPSFACWYADVTHEIKEVTSGYRLVLTYNLIKPVEQAPPLSALTQVQQYPALKRALQTWRDRDVLRYPPAGQAHELIYLLDHKYTDVSLKLQSLKGNDLARVQALHEYAKEYRYSVFLASMEHERMGEPPMSRYDDYGRYGGYGGYGYEDEDEDDSYSRRYKPIGTLMSSSTKLNRVVSTTGREILTDLAVNDSCIIQQSPFSGRRRPDDYSYMGYQGNYGAESTHWYRETVVVLVPSGYFTTFLLSPFKANRYNHNPKKDIMPVLDMVVATADSRAESAADAAGTLASVCKFIIRENEAARSQHQARVYNVQRSLAFPNTVLVKVVEILVRIKRYDLLASAVDAAEEPLPPEAFKALRTAVESNFDDVRVPLTHAMRIVEGVGPTYHALMELFGGDLSNNRSASGIWAIQILRGAASLGSTVTEQDARAIIDVADKVGDKDLVHTYVDEHIKHRAGDTQILLAFLSAWVAKGRSLVPETEVRDLFERLWIPMMQRFELKASVDPNKRMRTQSGDSSRIDSARTRSTASDITHVMHYLINKWLTDAAGALFEALEHEVARGTPEVLRCILVPFLRSAQSLARLNAGNATYGPLFKSLYRNVLEVYLEKYVKEQPPAFENWARDRVRCNCGDCWQLNLFLISSTQQVGRFPVGKNQRHHLHVEIDNARLDCTHETERIIPETLVVTKRDRRKGDYDGWLSRCREAADEIKKFDADLLREMLGRRYEKTVKMWAIIKDEGSVPDFVKAIPLATDPAPGIRAGTKRKAEVIDLSEE